MKEIILYDAYLCPKCHKTHGPMVSSIPVENFYCPECIKEMQLGDVYTKKKKNVKSISSWPTLDGRLSQPITTELEALQQLEKSVPLSEDGKKRLKKLS